MPGPVQKHKLQRGMGSLIRYSKTGPWTWQRRDSRAKKWIRISTGEVNRTKAEQKVYQLAVAKKITRQATSPALLFSTVASEYIEARKIGLGCKRLRPESIRKSRTAIDAFSKHVGLGYDALCVKQVDETLLNAFKDQQKSRITTDSANSRLNVIAQVLAFAVRRGYIDHDPSKTVERAFSTDLEDDDDALLGWPCPTPEEVRLILANSSPQMAATGSRAFNGSSSGRAVYKGINANDYTHLFATICMTGMRRNETRFLTWNDVDFQNKVILIQPGKKNGKCWKPKTRASIRRIPIVPQLETVLRRQKEINRRNLWVFETRRRTQLSADNPTKRLGEICDELGLKNRYVLHSLRKYWASTVAQQHMDWRVMLKIFGHSDFELILSTYYAQNDDARMLAEASKVDFGLTIAAQDNAHLTNVGRERSINFRKGK
jgi:integrase